MTEKEKNQTDGLFEKTVSITDIYNGLVIDVKNMVVELPNGKYAKRDLVMHPGASVVLPLTDDNELYMVKQYRKAIEKVSLEVPAGRLEYGEDPLVCAKRELAEETGLTSNFMEPILTVHSTPGFSNEKLHVFLAKDFTQGDMHTDEDEFLHCEKIKVKELVNQVIAGDITDAKTIIGILVADKITKGEWK